MSATKYDISIEQGATFVLSVQMKNSDATNFDLTGCSIAAMIRKTASSETKLADFVVTIASPPSLGSFTLGLSAAATSALPVENSGKVPNHITRWAYDVNLTRADATVVRLMEGVVNVDPEVTR